MDVESASAAFVLIAVTLLIAFVAAAEVALASTARSRVSQWIELSIDRAQILDSLLTDPARFLSTLMLLKNAAYVAGGAAVMWLSFLLAWTWPRRLLVLLAVWFVLVFVQIGSRALAVRDPERIALLFGPMVQALSSLLSPLSFILRWFGTQARGANKEIVAESIFLSEDGLRFLINAGEGEGVIEEDEKQMIESIFELGETAVREIMVPRLDIVSVEASVSIVEALDLIIKKGHSRIPVYEESIDHIIGFLYAKDLLRCFRDQQANVPIRQLLRKAYFVPQSKKLDELFHDMQVRQVHVAVVVDEYGGTAGLVTIEDLLEEIVGEIQDEYDAEAPIFQQLGPTAYLFNARIDLDEVSELIGVDLTQENDGIDTLGGFIYSQLGRVPEQGESLEYEGRRFTVLSVDSRRIEQVRVEWHPVAEEIAEGMQPSDLGETQVAVEEQKGQSNPFLRYIT